MQKEEKIKHRRNQRIKRSNEEAEVEGDDKDEGEAET